jgi:hypothetical protein
MATKTEIVSVRIESHSEVGVDLLPDVLRQLGAMVRLLTEFARDPRISKVEVLRLEKNSPMQADLRVVTLRESRQMKSGRTRPIARPITEPIRRLERAYHQATRQSKPKSIDATGLNVLLDAAKQLKSDVAIIETSNEELRIDRSLIEQINLRLGKSHYSRGTVTGILETLNVHNKPWSFTVYPKIGPAKIRCHFDEELFGSVQRGIRQVVKVHGLKEFVANHPYPVRMEAERIDIIEPASPGAWLDLVDNLAGLWDQATEYERFMLLEEQSA